MTIPLSRPYFDGTELEEIKDVLKSGWVAKGPMCAKFEKATERYLGVNNAIAVNNCTSGLHLSLMALGIGPGDEVLVPDFTFPATAFSVLYVGAIPVFVDIDSSTYNMRVFDMAKKITPKTKAIIPVHLFGQCANMDRIMRVVNTTAKYQKIYVVEDAACSFGAKYNGFNAGTIGDIGCFSFHARKGITTGEGGMIVTNNDFLANKMRKMSQFGIDGAYERSNDKFIVPKFETIGFNYKMSDIAAAVGYAQLLKIDDMIDGRREMANHLNKWVDGVPDLKAPYQDPDGFHVFQAYVGLAKNEQTRNNMIKRFSNFLQCSFGTYSLSAQPVFDQFSKNDCPVSKNISGRALALPIYYTANTKER